MHGIIVQSEGGDSWVASHLRPQSGTNTGNISLDFHHSCEHRPRKCEIQLRKTGLSLSIANNCLQHISYASLALTFLFFQTLSFLPHSHLHVLLTSSSPFYSHYYHLPSKFSFFIFIPMSPILTSFLLLIPFLYFQYYYFLLYIPPSSHPSCLSSISYFFIKIFIYSSHTFICIPHPFFLTLYFFLQHFALISPTPFPIPCFFTSFFFLSVSSSDHTFFSSFIPPSNLSLLPHAKYQTEGTILGNIDSLETTPGFMVPIGCQVLLRIPLPAKSSSLSLTFIVFLLGKVAAARDSCHLAAQFPRRSSWVTEDNRHVCRYVRRTDTSLSLITISSLPRHLLKTKLGYTAQAHVQASCSLLLRGISSYQQTYQDINISGNSFVPVRNYGVPAS